MGGTRDLGGPGRRAGGRDVSSGDGTASADVRSGGEGGGRGTPTPGPIETLPEHTRLLWLLAVGLYGVGDLLTTVVGVRSGRAVEAGPVAAGLVDAYGLGAVLPLKLGSILAFYLLWRATPDPHAVGVPLGLALVGALLTVWNTVVLLGALPSLS